MWPERTHKSAQVASFYTQKRMTSHLILLTKEHNLSSSTHKSISLVWPEPTLPDPKSNKPQLALVVVTLLYRWVFPSLFTVGLILRVMYASICCISVALQKFSTKSYSVRFYVVTAMTITLQSSSQGREVTKFTSVYEKSAAFIFEPWM